MGEILKVKLNLNNYNAWYPLFEAYVQSKGYKKHLDHDTFETWWNLTHIPTDREARFDRQYKIIKEKVLNNGETEADRDQAYQDLEDKYKDVLQAKQNKLTESLKWSEEEEKLRGMFTQSIESVLWPCFKEAKTTKEIIVCLKAETLHDKPGTFMSYLNQFFNLNPNDNDPLMKFVGNLTAIVEKINELGNKPTWEEIVVYRIISAMPKRASVIQQQICQLARDKMKIATIKDFFQAEDARVQSEIEKTPKTNKETAKLGAEQQQTHNTCAKKNCKNRVKAGTKFCTSCTNKYNARKERQASGAQQKQNDKPAETNKPDNGNKQKAGMMKMFSATETQSLEDTTWYIDSGCTSHFAKTDLQMSEITPDNTQILIASGDTIRATKKGTINFQTKSTSISMKDVIHAPKMSNNLFSVAKCTSLNSDRYVIFNQDKVEIFEGSLKKDGEVILTGAIDQSGLYAITNLEQNAKPKNLPEDQIALFSTTAKRTLAELHESLGHLSKDQILAIAESTNEFKIADPDAEICCQACDAGKMRRKKFAKVMPARADLPGESIVSDLCGKISPKTLFAEKYVITFIDEKSGYLEVFLAKKKNEAIQRFKEVRAKFNNFSGAKVKYFVTDGGGEYVSKEFDGYLRLKGIDHVKSPPNTPQRVGKAERLNRILFDHARAMLKARQMPLRFWGYAILYATYIRNRAILPGTKQTRYEIFYKKKPSYKHCLPFGCPVSFSNVDRQPKKLDDRAFKGIFIGFNDTNHTYEVFNLETNEVVETRDIKFYPDQQIDFENNDWQQSLETTNENFWFEGENDNNNNNNNNKNNNNINNELLEESHTSTSPIIFDQDDNINNRNQNNNPNNNNPNIRANNPNQINNNNNNNINDQNEEVDIFGNPINPPIAADNNININNNNNPPPTRRTSINNNNRKNTQHPADRTRSKSKGRALSAKNVEQILNLDQINTPNSFKEAMKSPQSDAWKQAIKEEIDSLIKFNTFKVVPRKNDTKTIRMRLVFKAKTDDQNRIERFKARLVAQGFYQKEGIDYFETFSPVLRAESLRFLISYAAQQNLVIHNLDVKNAFLQAQLAEEIYAEIPEFMNEFNVEKSKFVLKLNKSIYGLKQAGRVWNEKFTSDIKNIGFLMSDADPCIFIHESIPNLLLGIFVDDCFVVGNPKEVEEIKIKLCQILPMHDLGKLTYALGIKISQEDDKITLCQDAYVKRLLEKFQMTDCKEISTPLPLNAQKAEENSEPFEDINLYQQLVGSLIYLSNVTRPDLAYAVSHLARGMSSPTQNDWINAKRVLRYLKGTQNLGLKYQKGNKEEIFGYSDASYAEEKDRKSIGGYLFLQAGAAISWKSQKQNVVAQSSAEAEYIALAEASKESIWLQKFQTNFKMKVKNPMKIFEDNQSTIQIAANPIHSKKTKHIDVQYHAIRDYIKNNKISVKYLRTDEMVADSMTKSLAQVQYNKHKDAMGLIEVRT
jgi:hypothetical protein